MKRAKRKCSKKNAHGYNKRSSNVATTDKPKVTLIRMSDGRIRVVNSSAAAKYAGVSHQAFSRVLRRHLLPPENPKSIYLKIEGRVKAAYPELFDNPVIIEG